MGTYLKNILWGMGALIILVCLSPLIEIIIGLGAILLQSLISLVFWGAILIYILNPRWFWEESTPISFSMAYFKQVCKNFLLVQMIPGMSLLIVVLINKDWIKWSGILPLFLILGPLFIGVGIFSLVGFFEQKKNTAS